MIETTNNKKIQKYLLPPRTTMKKTLVLDLDETLVHSQFFEFSIPSDITIKIEIEKEIYDIHVLVRPGVEKFITTMKDYFEIVIFTASISKYADILVNIIDPNNYCPYRFFREHCTFINNNYVKNLDKLGRNLKDIIIVDNSPLAYSLHPNNGLPILSWFDDYNDYELDNITPILIFLSTVNDVRNYIPKLVINNQISYTNATKLLKKYGYNVEILAIDNKNNKIEEKDINQNNKILKTSINKEKNNDNIKSQKVKKNYKINIQIVQNNINNINNIIDSKQNKDLKNKIINYFGIINNTEQTNNFKQKQITENDLKLKQKKIITNIENSNTVANINSNTNKLSIKEKGHKRQNTYNINQNSFNMIEKHKERNYTKVNINNKNYRKLNKDDKNILKNNKTYFQHIKEVINKKRKRVKTSLNINTAGFINNTNKFTSFKTNNYNLSSKNKKRNNSNQERKKLFLSLESSDIILSKKIGNISNISKEKSAKNKNNYINKIKKIKMVTKCKPKSNRQPSYNQYDFLNMSLNIKNSISKNNNNNIYKLFSLGQKNLEPQHKKQKSFNENNFVSKLKNNIIDRKPKYSELISMGMINKSKLKKNDINNNKSNHLRLNTNANEYKDRLIKRNHGIIEKIHLKDIDFIIKKNTKKLQINLKNKNINNAAKLNYKNILNLYRTIDKSDRKNEREHSILNNISENLMNKKYKKISHQKTISYNLNTDLNISNILNLCNKYRYNYMSKINPFNNPRVICNKNKNKILFKNKVKKIVNRKIEEKN